MKCFTLFFHTKSLNSSAYSILCGHLNSDEASFPGLSGHGWLVAAVWDRAAPQGGAPLKSAGFEAVCSVQTS